MNQERVLRIRQVADGLVLRPVNARLDRSATASWRNVVTRLVRFAIGGRAVWIALGHYRGQTGFVNLPMTSASIINGYRLWFSHAASAELIEETTGAWEFEIGWLWLLVAGRQAAEEVRAALSVLAECSSSVEIPHSPIEACGMLADGLELWWLRPPKLIDQADQRLAHVARAAGWRIDADAG